VSGEAGSPLQLLVGAAGAWLAPWRHAAALGRGAATAMALFWDPRHLQELWLAELGRSTDRYLRSPAFLDLMQHHLATTTQLARFGFPFSLPDRRNFQ
jgi:hypothetical protein